MVQFFCDQCGKRIHHIRHVRAKVMLNCMGKSLLEPTLPEIQIHLCWKCAKEMVRHYTNDDLSYLDDEVVEVTV